VEVLAEQKAGQWIINVADCALTHRQSMPCKVFGAMNTHLGSIGDG